MCVGVSAGGRLADELHIEAARAAEGLGAPIGPNSRKNASPLRSASIRLIGRTEVLCFALQLGHVDALIFHSLGVVAN